MKAILIVFFVALSMHLISSVTLFSLLLVVYSLQLYNEVDSVSSIPILPIFTIIFFYLSFGSFLFSLIRYLLDAKNRDILKSIAFSLVFLLSVFFAYRSIDSAHLETQFDAFKELVKLCDFSIESFPFLFLFTLSFCVFFGEKIHINVLEVRENRELKRKKVHEAIQEELQKNKQQQEENEKQKKQKEEEETRKQRQKEEEEARKRKEVEDHFTEMQKLEDREAAIGRGKARAFQEMMKVQVEFMKYCRELGLQEDLDAIKKHQLLNNLSEQEQENMLNFINRIKTMKNQDH